jgi:hypothetical protein
VRDELDILQSTLRPEPKRRDGACLSQDRGAARRLFGFWILPYSYFVPRYCVVVGEDRFEEPWVGPIEEEVWEASFLKG